MVLVLRKRAASAVAIGEWEAKQTRSPCPLVASPVSSTPAADAAEQAGRSEEWADTLRRWDRCQRMIHSRRMPCLLLRSGHPEPRVTVTHRLGRSRSE